jgi:alpha-beta hydrolase superfamily lysophospholipase
MINDELNYIIEDGSFTSSINEKNHIYFLHYLPKTKLSKKIVHIVFQHGMVEYYKRHEEFFEKIISVFKQDVVVSAMDLVGHGKSGGNRAYIDKFENYTNDWLSFLGLCRDRFYEEHEVDTFVVAHSLGGLIVLNTLSDEEIELPFKINSIVLTNPCIAPNIQLPRPLEKLVNDLSPSLGKFRIPLVYDAYDLTHDEQKAKSFIHDQLISKFITVKLGLETLKISRNITRHSYFFKYPVFFILSGEDKLVDNRKARLFIAGMDKSRVKIKEYPKMRHDILNETCRNEVFLEIISYIKNNLGISQI